MLTDGNDPVETEKLMMMIPERKGTAAGVKCSHRYKGGECRAPGQGLQLRQASLGTGWEKKPRFTWRSLAGVKHSTWGPLPADAGEGMRGF